MDGSINKFVMCLGKKTVICLRVVKRELVSLIKQVGTIFQLHRLSGEGSSGDMTLVLENDDVGFVAFCTPLWGQ